MTAGEERLKQQFHDEMLRIYQDARRQCSGYRGTRFIQLVKQEGGYETAKRLLVNPDIQDGFTDLCLCGCLHLTAEHLVLEEEFFPLFSENERAEARKRLGR